MKNTVKNTIYSATGLALLGLNSVHATADTVFGRDKVGVAGEQGTFIEAVQRYINTGMTFLSFLAVIYFLWGGFNMLTAGGDDEKVKKGKTVIIQASIGLFVIFLSGSLIGWILGLMA
jgi:hypothetical protein